MDAGGRHENLGSETKDNLLTHSNSSNQYWLLVPQILIPIGQSEGDQGMPVHAMGCVAGEDNPNLRNLILL